MSQSTVATYETVEMGASQGSPIPQISEEDLQFICKNTDMTEDEARSSFTHFMENNPDGKMTRESFREMMKLCYSSADNRNLEKHIFRHDVLNFLGGHIKL